MNWLKICLKAISGVRYLHSGSILLNCAIGLPFCKVPWMNKNVNWHVLSEWCIKSSIICLTEKLFAFVQLLHKCEYFLDIELFCLQISFIWCKLLWCILIIQILHFWFNIIDFIYICAVRRLTAQIKYLTNSLLS